MCVQPETPWKTFSSWLLQAGTHYVAVDRFLRNLSRVVDWLSEHDGEARAIAERGKAVASALLTEEAAVDYWLVLLRGWSSLFREGQNFAPGPVDWDYCDTEAEPYRSRLRNGALRCSKGWLEYAGVEDFDRVHRYTTASP